MKEILFIILSLTIISSQNHHFFLNNEYFNEINNMQSTWKSGYNNRWEEFTIESIKSQMGTIMQVPEDLKLPEKLVVVLNDLPENFDSREQWFNCESIKEIRDQSVCGSCWAFGAAEAMSDRLCISSGQKLQTRISAEDLLACCHRKCGSGCKGGYPTAAWNFFKNTGIVSGDLFGNNEWCQPYAFPPCDHHTSGQYGPCGKTKSTPSCKKTCVSGSGRNYNSDKIYASNVYTISGEQEIMTEIFEHGPVEGTFEVFEDFLSYKSGVYQHTAGSYLGGHAIKIIGWGIESEVKFWLCVNSWNEGWGDNGTFKILKGSDHLGIEGSVVAGLVKL